jgi:hypothetical protein
VDGTRRKRLLHSSPRERPFGRGAENKKNKKQRRGKHTTKYEKQGKAFA